MSKNDKNLENEILKILSSIDVNPFCCGTATHSKNIAQLLNVSYEKIKKIMKEMKKEGLVIYENKVYTTLEDYEMQEYSKFRNIGWLLTDKARETDIWKEENKKEEKIFRECFGE